MWFSHTKRSVNGKCKYRSLKFNNPLKTANFAVKSLFRYYVRSYLHEIDTCTLRTDINAWILELSILYSMSETSSGMSPFIDRSSRQLVSVLSDRNGILLCLVFSELGVVVNRRQGVVSAGIPFSRKTLSTSMWSMSWTRDGYAPAYNLN
jgi:hypothetical protein